MLFTLLGFLPCTSANAQLWGESGSVVQGAMKVLKLKAVWCVGQPLTKLCVIGGHREPYISLVKGHATHILLDFVSVQSLKFNVSLRLNALQLFASPGRRSWLMQYQVCRPALVAFMYMFAIFV
jgi:hypothetical protein